MARQFRPQEPEQEVQPATFALPIHRPCVVYARQSTTKQTVDNVESARYQTQGLYEKALRLGWTDELVTVMIEGQLADGSLRGVSGRLRIDQRTGLTVVVLRIKADEIAAVLVSQESRLFRDETGIEYNTFIDVCKEHGVIIITDHYTYNFARPFDVKLFRMQCEAASDYVTYHVRGVLHPLKRQAALRGQYDGRAVAPGYIVDYDKESPTYKRYIVYEPHAKVVVWLFKRYRELGGSLWKLGRELEALPYVFPAFDGVKPAKLELKQKNDGYGVGHKALVSILTNPVYIGHWMLEERIVRYNNHPAIVWESDFFYAFNRLSPVTLDGKPNDEKPEPYRVRYTQNGKPASPALLKDIITSPDGMVYVAPCANGWQYRIQKSGYGFSSPFIAIVNVKTIDEQFIQRLRNFLMWQHIMHLLLRYNADESDRVAELRHLDSTTQAQLQAMRNVVPAIDYDEQIARYNKVLSGKLATLDLPPDDLDAVTRAKVAREVKGLRATIADLESKKADAKRAEEQLAERDYRFQQAFHDFDGMRLSDKQRLISIVARRVSIAPVAAHWLKIEIDWHGPAPYTDTGYLFRTKAASRSYTEQEDAILRSLYPNGDRDIILQQLPRRTWGGIRCHAEAIGLQRRISLTEARSRIPATISWDDLQFMEEHSIAMPEALHVGYCYWRRSIDDAMEASRRYKDRNVAI